VLFSCCITIYITCCWAKHDILIKVFDANGILLGKSIIYYYVKQDITINYKIDNLRIIGINEFDSWLKKVKPIVDLSKLTEGKLVEDEIYKDLSFLAGDLQEDFDKIRLLNNAYFNFINTGISAGIYYGMFRTGIISEDNTILKKIDTKTIVIHIIRATDLNIISAQFLDEIVKILKKIKLLNNTQS